MLFVSVELAYGSKVTIKNYKTAGTLLHSHQHLYPKEHPPEQQQVRCFYTHGQNTIQFMKASNSLKSHRNLPIALSLW